MNWDQISGDWKQFKGKKKWNLQVVALALLGLGAFITFVGCETKGPAERAGESIDKGIQDAKDAITPPGPMEKSGRVLDKAVKPGS